MCCDHSGSQTGAPQCRPETGEGSGEADLPPVSTQKPADADQQTEGSEAELQCQGRAEQRGDQLRQEESQNERRCERRIKARCKG